MIKYAYLLLALVAISCQRDIIGTGTEGTHVHVSANPFSIPNEDENGHRINEITALRFSNGILSEIISDCVPDNRGICILNFEEQTGTLYLLANAKEFCKRVGITHGMSAEEFTALKATREEMTTDGLMMISQSTLTGHKTTATLNRTVARIDVVSEDSGVSVNSITLKGLAPEGKITGAPSEGEWSGELTTMFPSGMTSQRQTAAYICAQRGAKITVTANVTFKESTHILTAELPYEIERNTVYSVKISGYGGKLAIHIAADGWDTSQDSESQTNAYGLVDPDSSHLPEGVSVSKGRDTVFIPHTPCNLSVGIMTRPGAEIMIKGNVSGTEITSFKGRTLERTHTVSVNSPARMPGSINEEVYLDVYESGIKTSRVTLAFMKNPTTIEGRIRFDSDGICDFGEYADGELGILTVPEGKTAAIESEDGSPAWIKLQGEGGRYRILGGWKPNDPLADGRMQQATLIISDEDGSQTERYSIRRRNQGLPVVRMGNTWWCKYNLRGDATDFSDQIGINDDPAPADLYEYLNSCTEEQLEAIIGGQYQSWSTSELPLRHDGNVFYHEGVRNSSASWGVLPPQSMAPSGYEMPDYDDYAFLVWSNNANLGGVGERGYNNIEGLRFKVRIAERDVSMLGHRYGNMTFYDLEHDGNHWVLYGLGHQWDTTPGNIATKNIILATVSSGNSSWHMEGYAQDDRPGQNWMKFTAQNNAKTRTLRCIKTPVEYIME